MNTDMQKRALAARDARSALLDLKKILDEAAATTHVAEMEAVHMAIHPGPQADISAAVRAALDRLESAGVDDILKRARQNLKIAIS